MQKSLTETEENAEDSGAQRIQVEENISRSEAEAQLQEVNSKQASYLVM